MPDGRDISTAEALAIAESQLPPGFIKVEPRMPESIKVGPMRYRVLASREAIHQERYDSGSSDLSGRIDFHKLTITVDPAFPRDKQAETLLHEVRHAIHRHTGCNQIHRENWDEELFVEMTNAMYLAVLRDNPNLVRFLVDGGD